MTSRAFLKVKTSGRHGNVGDVLASSFGGVFFYKCCDSITIKSEMKGKSSAQGSALSPGPV